MTPPTKVRVFRTPNDAYEDFLDDEPWRTVSWTWTGLRSGTRYDLHVACVYSDGDIKRNTLSATTSGSSASAVLVPQQVPGPRDGTDRAGTDPPVPTELVLPKWHDAYRVIPAPKVGQVGGATTRGTDRIDVFWRHPTRGSLFQGTLNGTDSEEWQLAELGPMTGGLGQVTAARSGPDRIDVFYRSAQHRLRQRFWTSTAGWSAEADLGGAMAGRPDAVSWAPGRVDVFYRGGDGQLIHRFQQPGRAFSGEIDLGGRLAGDPAVASRVPYALDVLYRSPADQLIHRSFLGTTWSGEIDLGPTSSTRPDFVAGLTAVSWDADRTDVFYVGGGSSHRLFQRSWDRGRWSPEIDLGADFAGTSPCVTSTGPGRLELFYLKSVGPLLPSLFLHRYGP